MLDLTRDNKVRLGLDFGYFTCGLWERIGLPWPAVHQLDMAHWLQHGPRRRIVRAFRGASKTWLTIAYCLWRLYHQPNDRIVLVSKSLQHSRESMHMARKWIRDVDFLKDLEPGPGQRDTMDRFDVGPSSPDRVASFNAYGVEGQLEGSRGNVIVLDDVETRQSTETHLQRTRLAEDIKEADRILKPKDSDIIALGTPHHAISVYDQLVEVGYTERRWPIRFPIEGEDVPAMSPLFIDLMNKVPHKELMEKYPFLELAA